MLVALESDESDVQWPCNRNRFIGGTYRILLALFFKGISQQNMAKHMVLTYLHKLDPEDLPLNNGW